VEEFAIVFWLCGFFLLWCIAVAIAEKLQDLEDKRTNAESEDQLEQIE